MTLNNETPKPKLSEETTKLLREILPVGLASTRKGAQNRDIQYLPAHVVISIANQIFGHGGWSQQVKEVVSDRNAKGETIGYRSIVAVTIHENGATYEDTGYCDMTDRYVKDKDNRNVRDDNNNPVREMIQTADEHAKASKGAVSDGLKRCFRHMGGMFGNELYENAQERKRIAYSAIEAWEKAGYNDDDAYDKVVAKQFKSTEQVPIAFSLASMAEAVKMLDSK